MKFVIVNGVVTTREEANITGFLWNRPLAVAQDVWFGYGGIPLLTENLISLQKQLHSLGAGLPALFKNKRELFRLCKRLLNKNRFYRSGYLHFQFFISGEEVTSLISAENYEGFSFPIAGQGLRAVISPLKKYSLSEFNQYPCHNRAFWKTAEVQNENSSLFTPVFLNEKDMVCEGNAANIFVIKKGALVTPSPGSGCYDDVLKKIVLEQAAGLKIPVIESDEIDVRKLLAADEIFLASEARGIEWVMGIENKRFVRSYSSALHERIDEYLKFKIQG